MDIPLSNPDKWDWDTSKWGKGHLNTGIEAVLSAYISNPLWVEPEQLAMYKKLKSKYRAMSYAEDIETAWAVQMSPTSYASYM